MPLHPREWVPASPASRAPPVLSLEKMNAADSPSGNRVEGRVNAGTKPGGVNRNIVAGTQDELNELGSGDFQHQKWLLEQGHPVTVKGSQGRTYVLRKKDGFYSCTCPLWRYQAVDGVQKESRSCKHLSMFRSREAELDRVGEEGVQFTRNTYRRLQKLKQREIEHERQRLRDHQRLIEQAQIDKQQEELEREWRALQMKDTSASTVASKPNETNESLQKFSPEYSPSPQVLGQRREWSAQSSNPQEQRLSAYHGEAERGVAASSDWDGIGLGATILEERLMHVWQPGSPSRPSPVKSSSSASRVQTEQESGQKLKQSTSTSTSPVKSSSVFGNASTDLLLGTAQTTLLNHSINKHSANYDYSSVRVDRNEDENMLMGKWELVGVDSSSGSSLLQSSRDKVSTGGGSSPRYGEPKDRDGGALWTEQDSVSSSSLEEQVLSPRSRQDRSRSGYLADLTVREDSEERFSRARDLQGRLWFVSDAELNVLQNAAEQARGQIDSTSRRSYHASYSSYTNVAPAQDTGMDHLIDSRADVQQVLRRLQAQSVSHLSQMEQLHQLPPPQREVQHEGRVAAGVSTHCARNQSLLQGFSSASPVSSSGQSRVQAAKAQGGASLTPTSNSSLHGGYLRAASGTPSRSNYLSLTQQQGTPQPAAVPSLSPSPSLNRSIGYARAPGLPSGFRVRGVF